MERVTRIELALSAWKAEVPPQHFTRVTPCNDSGTAARRAPMMSTVRSVATDLWFGENLVEADSAVDDVGCQLSEFGVGVAGVAAK